MSWQFFNYNEYVKSILVNEGVNMDKHLLINCNDESKIDFKFLRNSNTIAFGQNSITYLLLLNAFYINPDLINNLLYYYCNAFKSVSNLRVYNTYSYIEKIYDELRKKINSPLPALTD